MNGISYPICYTSLILTSFATCFGKDEEGAYLGATTASYFDKDTYTDNAAPIGCYWTSKTLDFSDQDQDCLQRWKTINKITLFYEDLTANTPVTIHVSPDGGVNWMSKSRSIGTGDGKSKTADFFFRTEEYCTAQDFVVRVECAAFNGTFFWTGLKVNYYLGPRYFEIQGV